MSVDMSFDYNFSFGPATPPEYSYELALQEASYEPTHGRPTSQSSQGSIYSHASSPEPTNTQLTTPLRSPIRQHGPLLLPKIRSQDQAIESPAKRVRKTASGAWRPGHARSFTNPETVSFMPALVTPSHSRSSSTLCSPISMASSVDAHFRRASSCSLDGQTIGKYGFPTYRQMPTYIASTAGTETFVPPTYFAPTPREPSPMRNSISFTDDLCYDDLAPLASEPTTTLHRYLSAPNPAPSLVRQLNIHLRDPAAKHFWWDVRQIRPWTSFTPSTISSIPGLLALLTVALPASSLPLPPTPRLSTPETEAELLKIYASFYATKLNSALAVAQGTRHLVMRTPASSAPNHDAHFVSNYTDDTSALVYGRGLGRVVGLVKSFDRWNSAMRTEGNHRKVAYLRGLAHLHRCMREHGCRYGFIISEIELLVVRNGAEGTPNFGYLEVLSVPLAEDAKKGGEEGEEGEVKMTALLALFYLHMLAKDVPLAGQVGWKAEIGAPAEGTRRKCLPKDEWMPEPQLAEKREAKRARGWVWPEEAVGRKELGKRGVRYGGC